MNTVGNQEMIRVTNQTLILNLIKTKGLISRADIARILNLSAPSTSSNVNQLLNAGLILEVGEGLSSGGRKPILLELNRQFGYIIAIDMTGSSVKVCIGNICAEIIDTVYFSFEEKGTGISLLIDIIHSINSLIEKVNISREKIKIIFMAVPGIFDKVRNKIILNSGNCACEDIDVINAVEKEYKTKVIVKNCTCVAGYGEYEFGLKQKCSNLLYINADSNISAGLIINGELFEGSFGAAGIIGSTVFSKEDIGGIYKRQGYLDTMVSTTKLIQKIKNQCKNDKILLELCDNNINKLDFGILKRAYEKNHSAVKFELDRVIDLIGISIANINCILNVDTIVLGGLMATLGEYYLISIKKVIGELCVYTPYITYSILKDNSTIYGAFALGQKYIIDSI